MAYLQSGTIIYGTANVNTVLNVLGTNTATNTTSGALVVSGGAGVAGNIYIGGNLVANGANSIVIANSITTSGAASGIVNVAATLGNLGFRSVAATYTDTAVTGTQANAAIHYIATPTITGGTNAKTYTNLATFYIASNPTAGTNATVTNSYALFVASGNAYFASNVTVGNIIGNGQALTGLNASNISSGTIPNVVSNNISNLGTVSAGSIAGSLITGNVANASLANVANFVAATTQTTGTYYFALANTNTSTNVSINSNTNINVALATGTLSATLFAGSGANLTSLTGANVTGNVANASLANVANFTVQTAQTTGTYYFAFSNVATTSNVSLSANASFSANLANGYITATGFVGSGSALTGITVSTIANGNSNVNIPAANGNVNISAVGNANIVVVTGTGANIAGTANVTGNLTVGTGTGGNISGANLVSANYFTGTLINGNSNISIVANANVNISANGTANILQVQSSGVIVTNLNSPGTVIAANITANTGYVVGSAANVTAAGTVFTNAAATSTQIIIANNVPTGTGLSLPFGTPGQRITVFNTSANSLLVYPSANGTINGGSQNAAISVTSGVMLDFICTLNSSPVSPGGTWYTPAAIGIANGTSNINIPAANGNINISSNGVANVLVISNTGVNVSGTLNTGSGVITGNGSGLSAIAGGNVTGWVPNANVANYHVQTAQTTGTYYLSLANVATSSNVSLNANTNINVSIATGALNATLLGGALTTAAQPNVTSVSTSFTNLTFANAQTISGNNLTVTTGATSNIGTLTGNWTISSGSLLRSSDGNASNVLYGNGSFAAVVATSATNAAAVLSNTSTNTTVYLAGTSTAGNANVALEKVTGIYANMGNNAITATTFAGTHVGNVIANTANGVVQANSHTITGAASGVANVLATMGNIGLRSVAATYTDTSAAATIANGAIHYIATPTIVGSNAMTYTNLATFYVAANPTASTNATVTNSYAMFVAAGNSFFGGNIIGIYANGNSNINIPAANGNVNISAVGTANVLVVTGTGANITGTANISGNANVGNIGAAQGIFTTSANIPIVQNGNSNVSIVANANINFGVTGTANVVSITAAGIITTAANAAISSNSFTATGAAFGNVNVAATLSNLGFRSVAATYTDTAVTGTQANAGIHYLAIPTITGGTNAKTYTNFATLYIAGNATPGTNATITNNYAMFIASGASYFAGNVIAGNIYANSGTIGASLLTGTLTTAAQPNVTSVGTLANSLTLTTAMSIASTGAVTIAAPASGNALTVTGVASSYAAKIIGSSTSGSSYGLLIQAGTTAADYALVVQNASGAATDLIINGVGNFGISQTPSAWGSGYTAIQIGPSLSLWTGGSGAALSSNLYYDGALRKYITSAFALEYQQNISSGSHIWYVAPSGTAGGTVSLTQAMSINSSGTVTIASAGASLPSLVVYGTSTNANLQYTDGTHTVYLGYTNGAQAYIGTQTSAGLGLITSNTNRLSITSGGAVTIAAPTSGNTLGISQFAGSAQLALNGSTSGTVGIQTAAAAGSWTLTLPTAVPASNNSVLVSTTAGVSSWLASTGSAGSNVLSTAPTLTGQVTVNASAAATKAILINGAASGSAAIAMAWNSGTGTLYWISAGTNNYLNIGGNGTSEPATGAIQITTTGSVLINAPSGNPSLTISQLAGSAQLALNGSTSGTVQIQTAAAAGTWTLQLPTTAGTSGYVLQTDGTGITSWTNTIATATTATNATNSAITNNAGVSSATWYPTFVSAGTGNLPITVDSTTNILSYVPSTGTLTATILNATSDARLKKNIAKIENPLDIISKLNGVRYQWINNDNLSAGLIAQEVEAVMPELVTKTTDGMKGINYNGVIGVLVESVKQLNSELTALRAEVAELKRV